MYRTSPMFVLLLCFPALAQQQPVTVGIDAQGGFLIDSPADIGFSFGMKARGFSDPETPRAWYFGSDGTFYTRSAMVMGGGWVRTPGGDARGTYGTIINGFAFPSPAFTLWNDTAAGCIGVRQCPAPRAGQWILEAKDWGPPKPTANDLDPAGGCWFFGVDAYGILRAGPPSYDMPGAAKTKENMDSAFGRVSPGHWRSNGALGFGSQEPPNSSIPNAGDTTMFSDPNDYDFPIKMKVRMANRSVYIVSLPGVLSERR